MDDDDLFSWRPPRARNSDPDTSHLAAASVSDEMADAHYAILLGAIHRHGPGTMYDIKDQCSLDIQQVNKRLPEMERRGWLCRPGWSTAGPTGRQCKIWYECKRDCQYRKLPSSHRLCDLPVPYDGD